MHFGDPVKHFRARARNGAAVRRRAGKGSKFKVQGSRFKVQFKVQGSALLWIDLRPGLDIRWMGADVTGRRFAADA